MSSETRLLKVHGVGYHSFFWGGEGGGLRCLSQISIDEVKAGQSCFDLNNEIFSLKFGSTA